jgi:hypothetical protein
MGGSFRKIGWSGMMVVDDERADIRIRNEWRTLAAALIEDEDVGWVIGFHESALGRAVDVVAFAQYVDVDQILSKAKEYQSVA